MVLEFCTLTLFFFTILFCSTRILALSQSWVFPISPHSAAILPQKCGTTRLVVSLFLSLVRAFWDTCKLSMSKSKMSLESQLTSRRFDVQLVCGFDSRFLWRFDLFTLFVLCAWTYIIKLDRTNLLLFMAQVYGSKFSSKWRLLALWSLWNMQMVGLRSMPSLIENVH